MTAGGKVTVATPVRTEEDERRLAFHTIEELFASKIFEQRGGLHDGTLQRAAMTMLLVLLRDLVAKAKDLEFVPGVAPAGGSWEDVAKFITTCRDWACHLNTDRDKHGIGSIAGGLMIGTPNDIAPPSENTISTSSATAS